MAHVNECDAGTLFDAPAPDVPAAGPGGCAATLNDGGDRFAPPGARDGDRGDDPAFAAFGGPDAR